MKAIFSLIFTLLLSSLIFGQHRTVHVFVALCDNKYQGIVPVPASLGNGKDPARNLYWGAAYGVKTYFNGKTTDWELIKTIKSTDPAILERLLFKHSTLEVYMLADAYDGEKIKQCVGDFLKASNGQDALKINYSSSSLNFGGTSDLVAYVGHDGLMDFNIDIKYDKNTDERKEAMILACYSKNYFGPEIRKAGAHPLLWTTHLMAPEAYTLKSALDGWIRDESGAEIDERAAQVYHRYQKCGIKGARNLFTTEF